MIIVENFIKDAEKRGDKVLKFSDKGDVVYDTEGFDHTRITDAILIMDGKIVPLEKTTTWAALLRSVNAATKKQRDKEDVAEECFNMTIAEVTEKFGLGMNQNFSMTLFDDDSFIKSSVYKNNQNHALDVWRGKKICAVYAGEVVVVLNALIASSGSTETDGGVTLLVSYRKRGNVMEGVSEGVEQLCENINGFVSQHTFAKQIGLSDERIRDVIYKSCFEQLKKGLEGSYKTEDGEIFQIIVEKEVKDSRLDTVNKQKIYDMIDDISAQLDGIKKILNDLPQMEEGEE